MKDGEEKSVEAKLVFIFVEGDESVGINEGFHLVGIEVGDGPHKRLLEVDSMSIGQGEARRVAYVFDKVASKELDELCRYEPEGEEDEG